MFLYMTASVNSSVLECISVSVLQCISVSVLQCISTIPGAFLEIISAFSIDDKPFLKTATLGFDL